MSVSLLPRYLPLYSCKTFFCCLTVVEDKHSRPFLPPSGFFLRVHLTYVARERIAVSTLWCWSYNMHTITVQSEHCCCTDWPIPSWPQHAHWGLSSPFTYISLFIEKSVCRISHYLVGMAKSNVELHLAFHTKFSLFFVLQSWRVVLLMCGYFSLIFKMLAIGHDC